MRNARYLYVGVGFFLLFVFYANIRSVDQPPAIASRTCPPPSSPCPPAADQCPTPVDCVIDAGRHVQCLRDAGDVYIPFERFLRKQFDVSGRMVKDGRLDRFEWATSYSKVKVPPEAVYDPQGAFGHFASYNVESRERVRCISAQYGVPMSTQWAPEPYFYPIQIAQYALQHYSRNKTELTIGSKVEDWQIVSGGEKLSKIVKRFDAVLQQHVFDVTHGDGIPDPNITVSLNENTDVHVVQFRWRALSPSSSFSFLVEHLASETRIRLKYLLVDDGRCVWPENNNKENEANTFSYALGSRSDEKEEIWHTVTRDLVVDAGRAMLTALSRTRKTAQEMALKTGDIRLISLSFHGRVSISAGIRQLSHAHVDQFLGAADWFISRQDHQGGWPVPVERSIADNRLTLPAGWHSAMAQGHALSVLTRAYTLTQRREYLDAAIRGLELFNLVRSIIFLSRGFERRNCEIPEIAIRFQAPSMGGVRNSLLDRFAWFEEYPTTPGSFVLNGFLYSLIGLYDLAAINNGTITKAKTLFDEGIASLRELLPLFDTGSGSIYDLRYCGNRDATRVVACRHLALRTAPNLARWDYHAVHIYLLRWIDNIVHEPSIRETADRWIAYAQGHRAKHN